MRLDTKEKRLEYRKGFLTEGAKIIDLPEIELQAFTTDAPNYYTLTAFRGTAGKPYMNYYYRTAEKRDKALQEAIENQKESLACRKQRRQENKGVLTGAAATAATIKAELKKVFPEVKFSVTSENFSCGNSVDIRWTDGPIAAVVENITRRYQYGYFDGMTDCYEYRKLDEKNLGCSGAKYVHCNREQSPERRAELEALCIAKYGRIIDQYANGRGFNAWYFENDNPEYWEAKYRNMKQEADRKNAEAAEAARQDEIAQYKREEEARRQELEASKKVISLADRRSMKQQAQEAKQEEESQKDFDYIMAMAQIMTSDQLKELITSLATNDEWANDTSATAVRPFFKILAERNSATALELFKGLNIVALMK
jgi:hypothetical protein